MVPRPRLTGGPENPGRLFWNMVPRFFFRAMAPAPSSVGRSRPRAQPAPVELTHPGGGGVQRTGLKLYLGGISLTLQLEREALAMR
jgi:hypothetical protein